MDQIEVNKDFYFENDRVIFTKEFHIKRGSCCGNGCRHCPYDPKHKRNTTIIQQEHDNRNTTRKDTQT